MSLPARREALATMICELDAAIARRKALDAYLRLRECQDAEVLEQGLNAAQERWARLVSDVVCGTCRRPSVGAVPKETREITVIGDGQ